MPKQKGSWTVNSWREDGKWTMNGERICDELKRMDDECIQNDHWIHTKRPLNTHNMYKEWTLNGRLPMLNGIIKYKPHVFVRFQKKQGAWGKLHACMSTYCLAELYGSAIHCECNGQLNNGTQMQRNANIIERNAMWTQRNGNATKCETNATQLFLQYK